MPAAADQAALTPLAWARIAFAAVVLIRTTPLIALIDPAIGADAVPLLGWPHPGQFRAALLGIVLPALVVQLLCLVRTAAAVLLLLGYRPLWSGLVTGLVAYAVLLQDVFSFTFTQHLLFVGAAVLGLTDCAAVLAVRPEPPRAPRTSYLLLWSLPTSVYFWAAFAKLRRDWLDGRTLGLFFQEGKLRGPLARLLLEDPSRRAAAAVAVVLTELALVPLLWTKRTRWLGVITAIGFHATIEAIARPDVFGWAMVALALSFVPLAQGAQRA
jgi:hypothetical protein